MIERDPLIGQRIGAYQIRQKLGEGGMARVYKAYHARLRRDVALKIILAHIAVQSDFRARFEQEAQLIASLQHPNIVAVYDFGEEGALAYLVMQYVGGGTLRDQLQEQYPLAPQRAAHYALQMAHALHHAHQRGIVHRDIKPQNMLVSAHDHNLLLLSDFGIAKLLDAGQEITLPEATPGSINYGNGLTSADQIIGTIEYMAPEQINRKAIDPRTDVYALGVVLFQMLSGRTPFLSTTAMGLMYQHVHTPAPNLREINPAVPEVLAHITARALEKAPAARFPSAEAMAQALERVLNQAQIHPYIASNIHNTDDRGLTTNSAIGPSERIFPTSSYHGSPRPPAEAIHPHYPTPSGTQAQNTEARLNPRTFERTTTSGGTQRALPLTPTPRAKKPISLQMIAGTLFLVIILVLLVMRFQLFTGETTPTQPSSVTKAFTETFNDDNHAGWIVGNLNGLTSSISSHQYKLSTATGDNNTHFPYPTQVGTLPKSFTLTAQITQDTGQVDRAYGIVFYMNTQNGQTQSCYAFIITSNGYYQVLRYANAALSPPLWQGQSSAIHGLHHSNTLQAMVRDGTFSFKINDQLVPLGDNKTSLKDTTYSSGKLGLLVAGPNTQFTVSQVQLALP